MNFRNPLVVLLLTTFFLNGVVNAANQSKALDPKCFDLIKVDLQKLKTVVDQYEHLREIDATQWLRWGREVLKSYESQSKTAMLASCQSMTNQELAAMRKNMNSLVLNIVCSVKHKMHYMEQCQDGKPVPKP